MDSTMNIKLENSCPPSLKCPPPPAYFPALTEFSHPPMLGHFGGHVYPSARTGGTNYATIDY